MATAKVTVVVAQAVTVYHDGVGYGEGQKLSVTQTDAKQLLADGLAVKP